MIMQVCSVFDKKVGAYMIPQMFRTKGEAIRSFIDACASESAPFGRHSEDYLFCCLGQYDDSSGSFVNAPNAPEILFSASDAVVALSDEKNHPEFHADLKSPPKFENGRLVK